jgi:hypothetical protein
MTAAATTKIREPGGAPRVTMGGPLGGLLSGIYPLHRMAKWVNDDYA